MFNFPSRFNCKYISVSDKCIFLILFVVLFKVKFTLGIDSTKRNVPSLLSDETGCQDSVFAGQCE